MAASDESCRSGEAQVYEFESRAGCPQLQTKVKDIWVSKDFSDITLHGRGGQIKAHKVVLSSYCTKLRKEDLDR